METSCPIEETMQLLSKKWTLLIIKDLLDNGCQRHKDLVKNLNRISPKTLSDRLKELEGKEIILRKSYPEIPPRVEYGLTKKGKDLGTALQSIEKWSKKWK